MGDNEYKISLGVDVDVSDIQSQISTKTKDTTVPIKIEIENLKDIKTQIQNLNKGNKPSLEINTVSLEKSLDRVATAIDEIKKSLNTVDGKSGMQSLLSSINQITTALGKAENETDSLVKSLSDLSKKDFSLNFNLKAGNSNPVKAMTDYGQSVSRKAIPALKEQINYLRDVIGKTTDADKALERYLVKQNKGFDGIRVKSGLEKQMSSGYDLEGNKISKSDRMLAHEEYLGYLKEVAALNNIDLSGFNAKFSKSASEIVDDTTKIQTGVKETEEQLERLKSVFGGINASELSATLDPILQDLKAIREAIDNLSKGTSIDGLTASFNRLSDVLDKLDANFDKIKNSLGNELAKSISADNAVKAAQQTGKQIGEAISDGIKQSLDVDSVIDKEVKRLMNLYGVKGKDAFNDIRQSLVNYKNESNSNANDVSVDENGFLSFNGSLNDDDIFGASGIRQVTSAIADNRSEVMKLDKAYEDLLTDIKAVNNSKGATKVRLSDMRSEWGSDYKTNKDILGSYFSEKYTDGIGIDSWVQDKSWSYLLDLDTSHQDIANQLVDLVAKAKAQAKKISGDELFKNGFLDMDNMESEITASINAINAAEQKIAQSSTQSANTIVQNQQRIQQSYEDTLAKQKQRVDEIDREIADYTNRITDPTRLDPNVDPFQQIEGYQNSIDTLEREKAEILANIEKIDSAFKKNENILNSFKQSLSNIGMGADEIDAVANKISNLGVQIETLNQKKSARTINTKDGVVEKEVLDVDISGVDEYGNAIKLTQQYDMATADLIKSIEKVSTVQQKAGKSTDTFAKQQKTAVSNLTSDINELNRKTIDPNESKPIKDSSHLDSLKVQYDTITKAIEKMGRTSNDNDFQEERNNVNALISEYRSLAREYKNAETVATSLRSKDIDTVKSTYDSKLDVLISKMRKDGVYTSGFEKGAENLRSVLSSSTDASGLVRFLNGLDKLDAGYKRASASAKEFNQAQKVGINVSGLESKIADLQRISPEIDKFETEIDGAKVSVQSLLKDLGQVKTQGDFSVVNSRFKAFTDSAKAAGIAVTEVARKMKSVDDIKLDMELGTYDNQLSQMYDKLDRLSGGTKELRDGIEQVENAYREMNSALKGTGDEVADRERLVQAEKEYAAYLEKTNNLIKIQSRAEAKDARNQRLIDDREVFQAKIDAWLTKNSAATKKFGATLLDLKAKSENCDRVTLNHLEKEFNKVDKAADKAGLKMMSVTDKIKSKAKEYMAYFSVAEIFMEVTQAMKNMFEQVKLIDSAMTELKKVTDESDATYDKFLTNAASRAKDIGTTIDGLVSSTADFARLGYGFEDAQGLAEVANIYAVVGDEIEGVEGATKSLISTMAAFKDEMNGLSDSDFALSIVDKMNEVANNFSISSGGLGEALQRSASSLATGNNTLDESISLITAANEVVQNPEKVGNAMKTISMRIRSAKSEMEEMGEDTEGMVESTATLRAEIKSLSGVDIMASATEFKSTYQILDEISQKWEDLSDISRATLIEKMAGKHQGNVFASLMENFDTARNALETSMNSSGSAMREHEKWQQSLEANGLPRHLEISVIEHI